MNIKTMICAFFGAIGAGITALMGGWSKDLLCLIIFMGIDFFTGLMVAAVFKNSKKTGSGALNSSVTYKGIVKKISELLFVVIANALDAYLGTDFIRSGVIVGFMVNELISIVENASLMGIVSPMITEAIDILKKEVKR